MLTVNAFIEFAIYFSYFSSRADILGKIPIRRPIIICIYDRSVECIARLQARRVRLPKCTCSKSIANRRISFLFVLHRVDTFVRFRGAIAITFFSPLSRIYTREGSMDLNNRVLSPNRFSHPSIRVTFEF